MNSDTQYQAVPTTTTTTPAEKRRKKRRDRLVSSCIACIVGFIGFIILIAIVFGIPLTFSYGLEYNKLNSFSTEPSYCHVNSIGRQRMLSFKGLRTSYVVWNVDIVKQPQGNNATEDLVVLRSNITALVAYDEERKYLVGETYPCYVHKKLLDSATNANEKINLRYAFQWEKPSKTTSLIWLCIGSGSIIIAIISAFIFLFCFVLENN